MPEHPELQVLVTAKSPIHAQVIRAALEAAGVPAFVDGGALNDEFALSQRMANLQGVEVQVPVDRLEDAQQALRTVEESRELLNDPEFDPGEPE